MKDEMSIKKQRGKLSSQICDKTDRRKEGLYDPAHEHDACGVGMIVAANRTNWWILPCGCLKT